MRVGACEKSRAPFCVIGGYPRTPALFIFSLAPRKRTKRGTLPPRPHVRSFLLTEEEKEPKKTVTPSPFKGDVTDCGQRPPSVRFLVSLSSLCPFGVRDVFLYLAKPSLIIYTIEYTLGSASVLDYHRAHGPHHYSKALSASVGRACFMSPLQGIFKTGKLRKLRKCLHNSKIRCTFATRKELIINIWTRN